MTPLGELRWSAYQFHARLAHDSQIMTPEGMRAYLETMLDDYEKGLAREQIEAEKIASPTGT